MWSVDANKSDAIANFQAELGKIGNTKGSWMQDYNALCTQYKIVPSPYIQSLPIPIGQKLYCSNSIIDLSSWRAALIAVCATGSAVTEISLHNVDITPQHLVDLATAVDSIGYFRTIKIEYSTISGQSPMAVSDALKLVIGGSPGVDYLSLRGCKFGDSILIPAINAVSNNISIQALNISDNDLSDAFVVELVKSLRLNPFLKSISLAKNQISGDAFLQLMNLKTGMDALADDAAFLKKQGGILGEKSKAIKATNKKRKKGGEEEFPEPEALPERNAVVDGKTVVVNKSLATFDMSWNPIASEAIVSALDSLLTQRPSSSSGASTSTSLSFLFRGIIAEESVRNRLLAQAGSSVSLIL